MLKTSNTEINNYWIIIMPLQDMWGKPITNWKLDNRDSRGHWTGLLDLNTSLGPRPSFIFGFERAWVRENTSYDVILDQRGCVHGDASFHHDIVSECLWPSSSLVRVHE